MSQNNRSKPSSYSSSSTSSNPRSSHRSNSRQDVEIRYRRKSLSSTGHKDKEKPPSERRRRSSNNTEYKNQKIVTLLKKIQDPDNDFQAKLKLIPDTVSCLERTSDMNTERASVCSHLLGIHSDRWSGVEEQQKWIPALCDAGFSTMIKNTAPLFKTMKFEDDDETQSNMSNTWNNLWSNMWNASDASLDMVKDLVHDDIMQIALDIIKRPDFKPKKMSEDYTRQEAVNACLGVLHNCVRLYGLIAKRRAREANILTVLNPYLSSDVQILTVKTSIIFAYVVNEEEMKLIDTDDDVISMIVNDLLNGAIASTDDRRSRGFTAEETADALNALAKHDNNKRHMVELDVVSSYFKMIEEAYSKGEVAMATRGLWLLSFVPEGIAAIKKQTTTRQKLLDDLVDTKDSNPDAAKSATGVLFNIKQANATTETVAAKQGAGNAKPADHIMISYNHGHKEIARKINEELKVAGYKTWLDVEQMHGSTLDAMASAVENSAAIIMCWSERYQDSINCRAEAEYAFKLDRPIVPVRVEKYQATGWLNMLLGSKLYIVCENTNQVPQRIPEILKQLQALVKQDVGQTSGNTTVTLSNTTASGISDDDLGQWNREQVQKWLVDSELGMLKKKLNKFDGELLCEYRQMNRNNPQLFFDTAHKFLGIKDLADVLKLARKLDRI